MWFFFHADSVAAPRRNRFFAQTARRKNYRKNGLKADKSAFCIAVSAMRAGARRRYRQGRKAETHSSITKEVNIVKVQQLTKVYDIVTAQCIRRKFLYNLLLLLVFAATLQQKYCRGSLRF